MGTTTRAQTRVTSRRERSVGRGSGVWGRWLLLLVVAVLLGGPVQAFDGPGPQGPPKAPPKSPPELQKCLDDYVDNVARCHDIWCNKSVFYWVLWFVEEDCNELYLDECIDNAQDVFDGCVGGGAAAAG